MHDFKILSTELALKVDRALLSMEEEDHYRLDIPAGERLSIANLAIPLKKALQPESWSTTARRFVAMALLIYAALFSVTNAPAYTKIALANWEAFMESRATPERIAVDQHVHGESIQLSEELGAVGNDIMPLFLTTTTYENRIEVPSIKVSAPIVEPVLGVEALRSSNWDVLDERLKESLLQGATHYPGTAVPGQEGNVVIAGHSSNVFWDLSEYNTLFALLPSLELGTDIYINYEQTRYRYQVSEIYEVGPEDVSVLQQGEGHTLTLITCTPVGTTLRRLIVEAELVD